MSFGGGQSQGQIRYSLILDDQATQKIDSYKTKLNQLNTTSTQVTTGQKTLGTNLNSVATQASTLGTRIKDNISKFAGFATGLSATTTGVLQLTAGFRDYGDAQIAVDRATRKLSLAQEAQNKAQDKLNGLTSKGIKSGKDFEQATLDLSQANQQLEIQTNLVGEAQERMFDSQTQFVASVIPTTLGAIGTLGSAFKDLGLNASKITGGLGKLSGSLGMSTKGFIGMAGAIGLASVAAVEFFDQIKRGGEIKELQKFNESIAATNESRQKEIDKLNEQKNSWGQILKDFFFSGPLGQQITGMKSGAFVIDEVIKSLESTTSRVNAAKPLQNLLVAITKSPMSPSVKAGVVAQIQTLLDMYGNENNWKAGYGATADAVAANTQKVILAGIAKLKTTLSGTDVTAGLTGAMRTMFINIFKGVEFGNSPMTQLFAIDPKPIAATGDAIGQLADKIWNFGTKAETAATHFGQIKAGFTAGAKAAVNFGKDVTEGIEAFNKERLERLGNFASGLDKVVAAFKEFHKGKVPEFEIKFEKAKKSFDKFIAEFGEKLGKADLKGDVAAKKYVLEFAQKGVKDMPKAAQDMMKPILEYTEKHKDDPPDIFITGLLEVIGKSQQKVEDVVKKNWGTPTIKTMATAGASAGAKTTAEIAASIDPKKIKKPINQIQNAIDKLHGKTIPITIKAVAGAHATLEGKIGVKLSQHGAHEWVDKPTLFMAGEAGKERVDISPVSKMSHSGSGGTGGDLIVHNHIYLDSREQIRTFKQSLGKNRYTLG